MPVTPARRLTFRHLLLGAVITLPPLAANAPLLAADTTQAPHAAFIAKEVMVPMRDGASLQTVIVTPAGQTGPLPILLTRTPYGVPDQAMIDQESPKPISRELPSWHAFQKDGYIMVYQNLRGRFKSEGEFLKSSRYDENNPKQPNETNDAWDTIDWLVKNIPNNNGRVGLYGVSYAGLTSGMALLNPHPALKAISEQASPADQWMNDDDHHYGALRESYTFEYTVMEEADRNANTHFDFSTHDVYDWYLALGPLTNVNDHYLHNKLGYWNATMAHPDYDAFWKEEAWYKKIHASTVPNLNVAGFWDQEDPWGPWQIFRAAGQHDPDNTNLIVAGPWYHGGWQRTDGDTIGLLPMGGHKTGAEFREEIEAPFFAYYLHDKGEKPTWKARMFETGSNTWRSYATWPDAHVKTETLWFHSDGTLSFTPPAKAETPFRQYISDPASPVPYRARPISPTYPTPEWRTWETNDQRFVDHRPDVLTFTSVPLDHDLRIAGPLEAHLFASTSGQDSDFIVKLIDAFPEKDQKTALTSPETATWAESMNGYQLPIAMEVRRGRYLHDFSHPAPLTPNKVTDWPVPLRDHDHVFLKGHRIMVQIQSTWFPLIDRNPQTWVTSIYQAKASSFRPATQRVYASPQAASHIDLPVLPASP
ncbi:CocE/NonD family hydrolase [Acetobacter fallax]|uniref:CocE/NonD family hydrolase n=1 Tax=Acetobacter fallax TaxID=1737473 RepID=A0ABX0KBX1_9PROT|nr:CocE/NonD family hydrolase [Acetobacter fallax]NHO32646.1 CocE/NonD family hydrolase [Acetobacter fallax]NHO36156.1 CocE/NonD family hydrolase [Acetobacter fallax]